MSDPTQISKRLAYVLRHAPESIGIELDDAGWIEVRELLPALREHGRPISTEEFLAVVQADGKKRYELSDDGTLVRAMQGHSVDVDLQLEATTPPPVLFHGTVKRFLDSIMRDGLVPGSRKHVHLSPDEATARIVGSRRGPAVILAIDAAGMHAEGAEFYQAANGVWLVEHVPPSAITRSI